MFMGPGGGSFLTNLLGHSVLATEIQAPVPHTEISFLFVMFCSILSSHLCGVCLAARPTGNSTSSQDAALWVKGG